MCVCVSMRLVADTACQAQVPSSELLPSLALSCASHQAFPTPVHCPARQAYLPWVTAVESGMRVKGLGTQETGVHTKAIISTERGCTHLRVRCRLLCGHGGHGAVLLPPAPPFLQVPLVAPPWTGHTMLAGWLGPLGACREGTCPASSSCSMKAAGTWMPV